MSFAIVSDYYLELTEDQKHELEGIGSALYTASAKDVINVMARGNYVIRAAEILKGAFIQWCADQRALWHASGGQDGFRESYSTLTNYRQAAERFSRGQYRNFRQLSLSKLYELAAPSYPADKIQAAIDAFIAAPELPEPLQIAVDNGEVGPARARTVAVAIKQAGPAVQQLAQTQLITTAAVVQALDKIAGGDPEMFNEIKVTGALQGFSTAVPLAEATASDVRAAFVEKRFGDWEGSRDVIIHHAPVIVTYNKHIDLTGSITDDQIARAYKNGGKFFITMTYVEPGANGRDE